MKKVDELAKLSPIFQGIVKNEEISSLMQCVDGSVKYYGAGDIIVSAGEELYFLGNLLTGLAQEQAADGSTLRTVNQGEMVTWGFSDGKWIKAENDVCAKTDCAVLWLRWIRAAKICNFSCEFHKKALENLERLTK